METKEETIKVQSQIKSLAIELGWSQNRLAQVLYTELHEWDDDDEISKFQAKIKKQLTRDTTKVNILKKYLEIIVSHPEAKNIDKVFNKYIPQNAISPSLREEMRKISQEISKIHNKDNQ